jgi:hypothetical protein
MKNENDILFRKNGRTEKKKEGRKEGRKEGWMERMEEMEGGWMEEDMER